MECAMTICLYSWNIFSIWNSQHVGLTVYVFINFNFYIFYPRSPKAVCLNF